MSQFTLRLKQTTLAFIPFMGHHEFMNKQLGWLSVVFSDNARREILECPTSIRKDLRSILTKLQKRESVGFPDVDSMVTVAPGCAEIRLKGADGIYRAFFIIETAHGILVFHSFKKKTQKTPPKEIETAKLRLRALLKELKA